MPTIRNSPTYLKKLAAISTCSQIVDTLAAHQLTVADIDDAVGTLGNDLVVIWPPEYTGETWVSGKTFTIRKMFVDNTGDIMAEVEQDRRVIEAHFIRPVALPTAKILAILGGEDPGEYDLSALRNSWLISMEDLRQRYEEHVSKQIATRLAFLKDALLAYDPTLFDTQSTGPEDELETGDLVRAKPRLYGELSLNLHEVAYVYDTDLTGGWLSRWNLTHLGMEQADCVLARVGVDGTLIFTAANTARLMRLTEAQALRHGNVYNTEFAREKKTTVLNPSEDV